MSASETVYNRWYILPAVTTDDGSIEPKYLRDAPDIRAFSGTTVAPTALEPAYAGLTTQFSSVSEWYIVRVTALGDAGWQALNELSSMHQDTITLATDPAFIGDVLSQRLGVDRSAAEWEQSFRVVPVGP